MKVLVVDGNSILNRAFYGIKLLTTKDGRFTNAVYGFMSIFLKLLDETKPDTAAVAFDLKKPTFRHKLYDGYKAGRKGMPPELHQQLPVVKEILSAMGYAVLEQEGFEADDILGTIAGECGDGDFCYIATGDRDSFQLIRDNVNVLLPHTKFGTTTTELYTPERIMEEYKVTPPQMIDIKSLQGDSSDNIPGVPGVGPKTAGELIEKYGSLDNIYENLESLDIKDTLKAKLRDNKDSAYLSYTLGTIVRDVPGCELEKLKTKEA
ncbi:MAG: DNA polymerase I, partial [Clostridiales bacterium]|nr:DNA polymerase I [Clostridiales bacterium]